jgi:uncharacterized protein
MTQQPPEPGDGPPPGYGTPPPPYGTPPQQGYGVPPQQGYGVPPQQGYGVPQQYAGSPGQPGQLSPQDERTWGMFAHLSALVAAFVALSFLGPLIVMLTQGQKSPFVRANAVEALNFQITTYIAAFVSFVLLFVLIGFVLLPLVGLGWLIFTIVAGVKANNGESYRYPINLRLVK